MRASSGRRAADRRRRALQLARERPAEVEPARGGEQRGRERQLVAERPEQRK